MLYFITMQLPALLFALFYLSTRGVFCGVLDSYVRYTAAAAGAGGEESLCSGGVLGQRVVTLGRGARPHLLLTTQHLLKDWKPGSHFDCQFTLRTPLDQPFQGFFAVLQKLSLRGKHDGCLDYVQFRKVSRISPDGRKRRSRELGGFLRQSNDLWLEEICGKFSMLGGGEDWRTKSLPHSLEFGALDELEVRLHVDKARLIFNPAPDIQIAFTSNLECSIDESGSYKPCGNGSRVSKCIHKQYFGDGVVNCPYDDCYDEGGCSPSKGEGGWWSVPSTSDLVSMVVAVSLFLLVLWLSRYCKPLAWCFDLDQPRRRAKSHLLHPSMLDRNHVQS